MGRDVRDGSGVRIGRVVDTFPWDGGGEIELVVVRLEGSLGGRRMLTIQAMSDLGLWLQTPFARWQVEDSPELSGGRHAIEDPDRARSYWLYEEPAPLLGAG
jgi:hypothetical protein